MSFFDSINKAIGSKTIGACLQLCGFNSTSDFQNFNMDTVNDIEKYVSNVCCALDRESRKKYIDPIFLDYPQLFSLSPVIKSRLVAFIQQANSFGQICGIFGMSHDIDVLDFKSSENILNVSKSSIVIAEIPNDDYSEETKCELMSNNNNDNRFAQGNYFPCSREILEALLKSRESKFENFNLRIGEDFELYQSLDNPESGYYMCKMKSHDNHHKNLIMVSFSKDNKPHLLNIQNHLRSHFVLKNKVPTANQDKKISKKKTADDKILSVSKRGKKIEGCI